MSRNASPKALRDIPKDGCEVGVRSIGNSFLKSFWFSLQHKIQEKIFLQILLITCTNSRDFNSEPFLDFVFNCNVERSESYVLHAFMLIFEAKVEARQKISVCRSRSFRGQIPCLKQWRHFFWQTYFILPTEYKNRNAPSTNPANSHNNLPRSSNSSRLHTGSGNRHLSGLLGRGKFLHFDIPGLFIPLSSLIDILLTEWITQAKHIKSAFLLDLFVITPRNSQVAGQVVENWGY